VTKIDKRSIPRECGKCGSSHFPVQACGSDSALRTHRQHNPPAPYHVENLAARGLRPWGDRLDTIEMLGNNVLRADGQIRRRGGIIEHPDWPKEAA